MAGTAGTPKRVRADDPGAVLEVTHVLDEGGLAVVPTDTRYGLAADALRSEPVEAVYEAKGRSRSEPLPVAVANWSAVSHVARPSPLARKLAARFLPGPLTLVVQARGTIPPELNARKDTIAVRIPDDDHVRDLAGHFGPVTITSANRSGQEAARTPEEALDQVGDSVDVVVDDGPREGQASTIVDATGEEPKVIRAGPVPRDDLEEFHG